MNGLTFGRDFGPFLVGVIDGSQTILRTDGYATDQGFERLGILHDRRVQEEPARA